MTEGERLVDGKRIDGRGRTLSGLIFSHTRGEMNCSISTGCGGEADEREN